MIEAKTVSRTWDNGAKPALTGLIGHSMVSAPVVGR
jgi:hypothetical protein